MGSATPSFAADRMLGRLATWLRLIGLDTLYDAALDGRALARRAQAERRILLTRDRRLLLRRQLPQHLFIADDDFRAQLRQVLRAYAIDPEPLLLTRCSRCNTLLDRLPALEAHARVPPYVAATQTDFAHCPSCNRVYWAATHVEHLRAELAALRA